MPGIEETPPYEDPEFDPEYERLLLYQQFRDTMQDCDADGRTVLLWTNKYMALVCAGVLNVGGHTHVTSVAHMVELSTGKGQYFLQSKCGPISQRVQTIRSDRFEWPKTDMATWRDIEAHYTLTHSVFTAGRAAEFAETFGKSYPGTPVGEPSVAVLLGEHPGLTRYQQYGACLLQMRDGLIPPLSPNEASKYSIGTD